MVRGRSKRREEFLKHMSDESVACYVDPYRTWDGKEKEYLPIFLSELGGSKLILDLAGGYGKATPLLLEGKNSVVLADLSVESLRNDRAALGSKGVQFVLMNMLKEFPFIDEAFDGIWFIEAFEYVPPDQRTQFLRELRRAVKRGGPVFLTAEGLSDEMSLLSYLKSYLYWKLVKRAPIMWGELIYKLDLPLYKGLHYHSLLLNRSFEKQLTNAGFEIVKSEFRDKSGYSSYLMRAV